MSQIELFFKKSFPVSSWDRFVESIEHSNRFFRMRESLKKVLKSFEIHFIHADWMNHVINNGCLGCLDLDRAVHPCAVVIRDSKSPKNEKNEWDLLHQST